jgi:sRNA-binding protein
LKIALGTLKEKGDELAAFLEPRVGAKPSLSGDAIEIEDEGLREGVRPRQVKTYIKRFLYMKGVRKNYRVFVAGKELTIQEIELGKEEEEEKKKPTEKKPEEVEAEVPAEEPQPAEEEEAEAPKEEAVKETKPKAKKSAAKKPRAKKKKSSD